MLRTFLSALFLLLASAAKRVHISKEMALLLEKSLAFCCLTHGAFDITYASLGRYFDYRTGQRPTDGPDTKSDLKKWLCR